MIRIRCESSGHGLGHDGGRFERRAVCLQRYGSWRVQPSVLDQTNTLWPSTGASQR